MDLDDPLEVQRATLLAFKRHTAFWPVKKFWYVIRMARKGVVKARFKRAKKAELNVPRHSS
jgi:hypothetical protein